MVAENTYLHLLLLLSLRVVSVGMVVVVYVHCILGTYRNVRVG